MDPSDAPSKTRDPSFEVSEARQGFWKPLKIEIGFPSELLNTLAWFLSAPPTKINSFLGFVNLAV